MISAAPATTPETRVQWVAVAAVGFTILAWASAFVAIRAVGHVYGPGELTLGRVGIGALALGAGLLVARRGWVRPNPREWGLLILCGVAWFGIYNVALNAGEQRVDAGTAAMLVQIGPILIALFAGLLLGEGFPRWLVIGAIIAFGGAVLVGAATADVGSADMLGSLLCLVAAVTYAIGVLAQKPLLRRLPGLQVMFIACAIGAVACLPYAPSLVTAVAAAPAGATAGVVYLGLVPTALGFSTWGYALARMDAGRLAISTYIAPPVTILMSAVALAETPPLLALAGGAVCLVGVALSRRR